MMMSVQVKANGCSRALVFVLVAIVMLCTFHRGLAYSTGAPMQACGAAAPQHHDKEKHLIKPQTSPSPFSFKVDSTEYKLGEQITVTIDGSDSFGGFMIQARQVASGAPVGSFSSPPSHSQLRPCMGPADGVTHTDPLPKKPGSLAFSWSVKEDVGPVYFFGTVAVDHDKFWSNIRSAEIKPASGKPSSHLKLEPRERAPR